MFGYLRLEATRMVRDVKFAAISLAAPLLMFVALSGGVKGPSRAATLAYLTVAMAAFGAMGAVLSNGSTGLAEDKGLGWLRQLRLTPLRSRDVVAARSLVVLAGALPPVVVIQLAGALGRGVQHTPAQWAATTIALWLGVAPVALIALGLGYLLQPKIAQGLAIVSYLGLSIIGGLWEPVSQQPHWQQVTGQWTPVGRLVQIALGTAAGGTPDTKAVAVLAGWTAIAAGFAVFAYRKGAPNR
jgi:ABC-2 type transport system permease protein